MQSILFAYSPKYFPSSNAVHPNASSYRNNNIHLALSWQIMHARNNLVLFVELRGCEYHNSKFVVKGSKQTTLLQTKNQQAREGEKEIDLRSRGEWIVLLENQVSSSRSL